MKKAGLLGLIIGLCMACIIIGSIYVISVLTAVNIIITIIVSVFCSTVVTVLMTKSREAKEKKEKEEREKSVKAAAEEKQANLETLLKDLVELNLKVKLEEIDGKVLSELEPIVDKLFGILPKLNNDHPGSELTYVVNKMASEYLEKLLDPYLRLDQPNREVQTPQIITLFKGMQIELDKIIGLVDAKEVNDFTTQATFLKHKFFAESIGA